MGDPRPIALSRPGSPSRLGALAPPSALASLGALALPYSLALLGALCSAACEPDPDAAPEEARASAAGAPVSANTAPLRVDGVPIERAEVERAAGWIALLHPEHTEIANRRTALVALLLERAAVAAGHTEARERALEECRRTRAALATPAAPVTPVRLDGGWDEIGLETWGAARELPPGAWSPVEEGVGRWFLVRLDERRAGDRPGQDRLAVSLLDFPYAEAPLTDDAVQRAVDRARLEIVDPNWEDLVPLEWRHRMQGTKP